MRNKLGYKILFLRLIAMFNTRYNRRKRSTFKCQSLPSLTKLYRLIGEGGLLPFGLLTGMAHFIALKRQCFRLVSPIKMTGVLVVPLELSSRVLS